jgi:hypothetical protein
MLLCTAGARGVHEARAAEVRRAEMADVHGQIRLGVGSRSARSVRTGLQPIRSGRKAAAILAAVGEDPQAIGWERAAPGLLPAGSAVDPTAPPLFPRVDAAAA